MGPFGIQYKYQATTVGYGDVMTVHLHCGGTFTAGAMAGDVFLFHSLYLLRFLGGQHCDGRFHRKE